MRVSFPCSVLTQMTELLEWPSNIFSALLVFMFQIWMAPFPDLQNPTACFMKAVYSTRKAYTKYHSTLLCLSCTLRWVLTLYVAALGSHTFATTSLLSTMHFILYVNQNELLSKLCVQSHRNALTGLQCEETCTSARYLWAGQMSTFNGVLKNL